jgi:hypothetical protein
MLKNKFYLTTSAPFSLDRMKPNNGFILYSTEFNINIRYFHSSNILFSNPNSNPTSLLNTSDNSSVTLYSGDNDSTSLVNAQNPDLSPSSTTASSNPTIVSQTQVTTTSTSSQTQVTTTSTSSQTQVSTTTYAQGSNQDLQGTDISNSEQGTGAVNSGQESNNTTNSEPSLNEVADAFLDSYRQTSYEESFSRAIPDDPVFGLLPKFLIYLYKDTGIPVEDIIKDSGWFSGTLHILNKYPLTTILGWNRIKDNSNITITEEDLKKVDNLKKVLEGGIAPIKITVETPVDYVYNWEFYVQQLDRILDYLKWLENALTAFGVISPIFVYQRLHNSYAKHIVRTPLELAKKKKFSVNQIGAMQANNVRLMKNFNKYAIPTLCVYYVLIWQLKTNTSFAEVIKQQIKDFNTDTDLSQAQSSKSSFVGLLFTFFTKYKLVLLFLSIFIGFCLLQFILIPYISTQYPSYLEIIRNKWHIIFLTFVSVELFIVIVYYSIGNFIFNLYLNNKRLKLPSIFNTFYDLKQYKEEANSTISPYFSEVYRRNLIFHYKLLFYVLIILICFLF